MPTLLALMILAQTVPGPVAKPAPVEPTAPVSSLAPRAAPAFAPLPEQTDHVRAYRIPAEILGGTLLAAAFGTVAGLTYCGFANCEGLDGLGAVAVALIVAPVGYPLGVTLVGNWMDGDGSFWASALGMLIGGGLDALIFGLGAEGPAAAVVGVALPVLGGVVGYEWTSVAHRGQTAEVALVPMATTGPRAMAGVALAGAF